MGAWEGDCRACELSAVWACVCACNCRHVGMCSGMLVCALQSLCNCMPASACQFTTLILLNCCRHFCSCLTNTSNTTAQGITYQSIRSEDHTGTTKIQLHTATFRDPQQQAAAAAAAATAAEATPSRIGRSSLTSLSQYIHGAGTGGGGAALDGPAAAAAAEGSVVHSAGGSTTSSSLAQPVQCLTPRELGPSAAAAAAAAEEAGIILAPWNPDESWERDELVRIYAIHGALEKRHVVYEHIEVLVHPIRVHLTAALAAALQDYFNLKDEDSKLLPGAAGKGGKGQPEAANARGGPKPAGAGSMLLCTHAWLQLLCKLCVVRNSTAAIPHVSPFCCSQSGT